MRKSITVTLTAALAALLMGAQTAGAAAATPPPSRAESMTILFAGPPGAAGAVIVRGVVFDIGSLTPNDGDVDSLVFPDGTLDIEESGNTVVQPLVDPTCVVRFKTVGTYRVVGGTGRFAGATGGGQSVDSGFELIGRSGGECGTTGLFVFDKVTAHGTLTVR